MNTYLITGVTGFLGSYLAEALLALGERVIGIGRREQGCLCKETFHHPSFKFLRGDVIEGLSSIRGENITGVFHCASRQPSSPDISYEDFYAGNVASTRAAALFGREVGARFVIYPSSTAVYGMATDGRILDETSPVAADTWYGLTKYAGERVMALTLAGSATRGVAVRFPSLYGRRHTGGVVYTYYRLAASNSDMELFSGGRALRTIVHAYDAVRLLLKIGDVADSFETFTVFTAGSLDARPTADIAAALIALTGSRSRIVPVESGRAADIVVFTDNIQRVLGFVPESIDAGLRRYVEEMRHEI